jgi:hypothetical protein
MRPASKVTEVSQPRGEAVAQAPSELRTPDAFFDIPDYPTTGDRTGGERARMSRET